MGKVLDTSSFTGTTQWFRHFTGGLYTDGVKYVADTAGAYWLLDVVFSHQMDPKVRSEEFQVWTLKVNLDKFTGVVTMTDGNGGRAIVTQEISFTDFPEAEQVFWLEGKVLLVPSEH